MIKGEIIKRFNSREIIVAEYELGDSCNNGYDNFSVCVVHYHLDGHRNESKRIFENRTYYLVSAGTDEKEITEYFPELKPVLKLSGCDVFGLPSYPLVNGIYYLETDLKYGTKYLRLTKEEATTLVNCKPISFVNFLKELMETRYKIEVKEAITVL